MTIHNLVSFLGIFVLLAFAWLCSSNRRVVNWRAVVWGTALSLAFALVIFVVPAGTKVFLVVNDVVVKVLDSATAGTQFVFGRLALSPGTMNAAGE
ncbi:MAG: nucleoside transporter, partial [Candidatus Aminicenantes bacterium]|nr:nucleoside transporter [Candidatus Aminicenantes bacterium]